MAHCSAFVTITVDILKKKSISRLIASRRYRLVGCGWIEIALIFYKEFHVTYISLVIWPSILHFSMKLIKGEYSKENEDSNRR